MSTDSSFGDISDASDVIQLNTHNSELILKNEQLAEEVVSLKRQLDEAIEFSEKNVELQKENARLVSMVRSLTSEKEDLTKRFSLLVKSQEERSVAAPQQKIESASVMIEQNNALRAQNSTIKADYENYQKIMEERLNSSEKINKENNSLISDAIIAGSAYFSRSFKNINEMTDFLATGKQREQESKESHEELESKCQEKEIDIAKLLTKVSKLKKANSYLKTAFLESERANKVIQDEKKSLSDAIENMKNENLKKEKEMDHKQSLENLKRKQETMKVLAEVEMYKTTIMNLKNELERLKKNNESISSDDQSLEAEKLKIVDLEKALMTSQEKERTLKKRMISVAAQFKDFEKALKYTEKKNQSLLSEKEEFIAQIKGLKKENSRLKSEVETSQEKLNYAVAQVKSAKISFAQSKSVFEESESQQVKLFDAMKNLEQEIEDQKDELQKLYAERETFFALIKKHDNVIAQYLKYIQSLEDENKSMKQNAKNEQKKIVTKEEIPVTAWFSATFPRNLCEKISEIAKNPSLSTTTKLRSVLSTIADFYQALLVSTKDDLNKTKSELDLEKSAVENFLAKVGEALQTVFPKNDYSQLDEIASIFSNIFDERKQAIQEAAELNDKHQNILSMIEAETSEEAVKEINKIFDYIEKQTEVISNLKIDVKKLKKIQKISADEISYLTTEKENVTDELSKKLQEQKTENEENVEKLYESEKKLTELRGQIEIANAEHEKELESNKCKIEELKLAQSDEIERINNKFMNDLSAKDKQIKDKQNIIENLEKEIEKNKQKIAVIEEEMEEKEKEIISLNQESEDANEQIKKSVVEDVKLMKERYDTVISQIKEKNADIINLNNTLTDNLEMCEEKLKAVNGEKAQLEHRIFELQNKFKAFEEATDKEKRIQQSKLKAQLMEQEISFQCAIEEEKYANKARMQTLYDYASNIFKDYFDPSQPLDDHSFTELCGRVKYDLDSLKCSDDKMRALLGIDNDEKLDEALSKFILSFYSK